MRWSTLKNYWQTNPGRTKQNPYLSSGSKIIELTSLISLYFLPIPDEKNSEAYSRLSQTALSRRSEENALSSPEMRSKRLFSRTIRIWRGIQFYWTFTRLCLITTIPFGACPHCEGYGRTIRLLMKIKSSVTNPDPFMMEYLAGRSGRKGQNIYSPYSRWLVKLSFRS